MNAYSEIIEKLIADGVLASSAGTTGEYYFVYGMLALGCEIINGRRIGGKTFILAKRQNRLALMQY